MTVPASFLDDGDGTVTVRARIIDKDGKVSPPIKDGVPAVMSLAQGGLLDVALDPNFAANQMIYWSFSEPKADDGWTGRTGLVHQTVMADLPDLSGHQVYACGAPIVVDSARRDFVQQCQLPEDEFYADAFTSEADKHGDA